jgi:hypothetical protein
MEVMEERARRGYNNWVKRVEEREGEEGYVS